MWLRCRVTARGKAPRGNQLLARTGVKRSSVAIWRRFANAPLCAALLHLDGWEHVANVIVAINKKKENRGNPVTTPSLRLQWLGTSENCYTILEARRVQAEQRKTRKNCRATRMRALSILGRHQLQVPLCYVTLILTLLRRTGALYTPMRFLFACMRASTAYVIRSSLCAADIYACHKETARNRGAS